MTTQLQSPALDECPFLSPPTSPAARLLDAQARLQAGAAALAAKQQQQEEAGHARARLATLQRQVPRARAAAAATLRRAQHALEAEERAEATAEVALTEAECHADECRAAFTSMLLVHRPGPRSPRRGGGQTPRSPGAGLLSRLF